MAFAVQNCSTWALPGTQFSATTGQSLEYTMIVLGGSLLLMFRVPTKPCPSTAESHTDASGASESSGQPGTATSLPSSLSLWWHQEVWFPPQWPTTALSKQSREQPSPAHPAAPSPSTSPALELLGRAPF